MPAILMAKVLSRIHPISLANRSVPLGPLGSLALSSVMWSEFQR